MLLILAIAAALQLITLAAGGFLDKCPVDRDLRVDNELVMDVLETFAKDLAFVRASTPVREARDYEDLMREMHNDYQTESLPWSSADVHHFFDIAVDLLQRNLLDQAKTFLTDMSIVQQIEHDLEGTYLQYLRAEVDRLLGKNRAAAVSVIATFSDRQSSIGVSINQLERLDGLIALQKVSVFNQKVDKLHGLTISPDYRLLSLVHLVTKGELTPLAELRGAVADRLSRVRQQSAPPIGSSRPSTSTEPPRPSDLRRVEPHLDDFSGQSVSYEQAEGVLCEFARKLSTMEISTLPQNAAEDDYSDVIAQLRRLNATLADRLDAEVVRYISADPERARQTLDGLWEDMLMAEVLDSVGEVFMTYFHSELIRRSDGRCDLWSLQNLQDDANTIKDIRKESPGLSVDKMFELQARVTLTWMKCFHARVRAAYELNGSEDERQLAEKRARLGTQGRTLPEGSINDGLNLV